MNHPLVSVIIPHFNRTRLLAETIESVRRQTMEEWEAIVVDDGSEEDEWERLQSFRDEKISIFRRENQPKGPSACRNIGIREANGEYIVFLDSDDLLAPWCLENRVKDFRENPGMDFLVFPSLLFEHKPGDSNLLWNKLDKEADQLERFLYSDPPWCVTSPIWKRATLVRLGGFKEEVFYGDDAELHIRALLMSYSYKLPAVIVPDHFIRRSNEERITKEDTKRLQSLRLRYLETVRNLLTEHKSSEKYHRIWEGEFFTEADSQILKQNISSIKELHRSIESFIQDKFYRTIIHWYVALGSFLAGYDYSLVKIVRKLFFVFLPSIYTRRLKAFSKTGLSSEEYQELLSRINP